MVEIIFCKICNEIVEQDISSCKELKSICVLCCSRFESCPNCKEYINKLYLFLNGD